MSSMRSLIDLAPVARLALLTLLLGSAVLGLWAWRQRGRPAASRVAALVALTLFLTFDLIVFGAFTRLSDSGLGCPDWPGCYGHATPFGAQAHIDAAQAAVPGGAVTWSKAWIEMIHRYLAMTVGLLIAVTAAVAWALRRRLPLSPWWPTATLVWVIVQGAFGKFTVTLKLYPAVVTLHLLGGLVLLVLLARQHAALRAQLSGVASASASAWAWASASASASAPVLAPAPAPAPAPAWASGVRRAVAVAAPLLALQVALGAWVSSNYAVLACSGFPRCNGQWWPAMDWRQGFTLLRGLGEGTAQGGLRVEALVAIHMAHRIVAVAAVSALALLAWRLWRAGAAGDAAARRWGIGLAALLALQVASGLSNVVLGWPLAAALGHSAGAAGLVLVLALLAFGAATADPRRPRIVGSP